MREYSVHRYLEEIVKIKRDILKVGAKYTCKEDTN